MKLTPSARHGPTVHLAALAPLLTARVAKDWFERHRYILSLAGNDAGSNFLFAANLGALVLKVEDGWELF